MNLIRIHIALLLAYSLQVNLYGQSPEAVTPRGWEHTLAFNFYVFQDPFIFLPTYEVDKGHLHLGLRYNYEDLETFSTWAGYNFFGGGEFEYTITPMAGWIVGQSDGIAGGLLMQFDYRRWSLYAESEYVIDVHEEPENYFYNWTDFSYALKDWLFAGISLQRTRLYQSSAEMQGGMMLGAGWKNFEFTTYLYNPWLEDSFLILNLSTDF